MNIKEAKEYLKKNDHFKLGGLHTFICFYYSPVTNTIERRMICVEDYAEGKMWLDNVCETYINYKFPFACYINGKYENSIGSLETGEWE